MPVICPTCQSVFEWSTNCIQSTKRFRQIATALADCCVKQKARRHFRRGLHDICDDANVPLICPTRQVAKANQIQTGTTTLKRNRWAVHGATCGPTERKEAVGYFTLLPCSRFCRACSMRQAITRLARWVSRCADMAACFATVRFSCWSLPDWLRAGAHSSACADALVRKPANFGDDVVVPLICPARQTTRLTAAPGSRDERALAWVAQALPAASVRSA